MNPNQTSWTPHTGRFPLGLGAAPVAFGAHWLAKRPDGIIVSMPRRFAEGLGLPTTDGPTIAAAATLYAAVLAAPDQSGCAQLPAATAFQQAYLAASSAGGTVTVANGVSVTGLYDAATDAALRQVQPGTPYPATIKVCAGGGGSGGGGGGGTSGGGSSGGGSGGGAVVNVGSAAPPADYTPILIVAGVVVAGAVGYHYYKKGKR